MVTRQRLSTIYAKTNSEYISPIKTNKKNIKNENNNNENNELNDLTSGRLLDNVVMYLNYRDNSERTTSTKLFDTSPMQGSSQDIETIISTIISNNCYETDLLNNQTVQERILNTVNTINYEGIRWFHCMTRSSFRSVLEFMKVQNPALNILLSTIPKSNLFLQKDGSIVLIFVSLTLDDSNNVNMDQVSIYIQENIIISFECLTSGNIIPENMFNLIKTTQLLSKSIEKTVELPHETMKADEFDPTLSREYYIRMLIDEFSSSHIFFNEMKSKLKYKFNHPGSRVDSSANLNINPTHHAQLPKLPSFHSHSSVTSCPQDISYFIYESIHTMLNISTPVLNIYLSHQKELSINLIFATHQHTTDTNNFKDKILILRSGLNLISNLIERTYLCLETNTSLLTSLLALRPEYTTEILDNYFITFTLVQKLQTNLEKLNNKIINYEKKKTDQVKSALSMVSVFFLPIGFLASVCGQNFHNKGLIIHFLYLKHGTDIFIALNCFLILVTIIIIYYKGWGDTLGDLHFAGKIILSQTLTKWSQLFQHSNGIKMSKEEIELMISSRKGTISNKFSMQVNTRRYQKRYGEGTGTGGDRLRNFSV